MRRRQTVSAVAATASASRHGSQKLSQNRPIACHPWLGTLSGPMPSRNSHAKPAAGTRESAARLRQMTQVANAPARSRSKGSKARGISESARRIGAHASGFRIVTPHHRSAEHWG